MGQNICPLQPNVKELSDHKIQPIKKQDYQEEIRQWRNTLIKQRKNLKADNKKIAVCYGQLGKAHSNKEDYQKALDYHTKQLQIKLKRFGKEDPQTGICYGRFGQVYQRMKQYQTSISYYILELQIFKKFLGRQHIKTADCYSKPADCYSKPADCYSKLGNISIKKGDNQSALRYLKEELQICQNVRGRLDFATAYNYHNISFIYEYLNKLKEAQQCIKQAYDIRRMIFGDIHQDTQKSFEQLKVIQNKRKNIQFRGY